MDDVLILYSETKTQDGFGVWRVNAVPRAVFCQVDSVTGREFFDGGRNGLNPELRFRIFRGDYNGETVCAFHGLKYAIYRTFIERSTDYIELYVQREGGTNGTENLH